MINIYRQPRHNDYLKICLAANEAAFDRNGIVEHWNDGILGLRLSPN
jgi:hypothetical protein